MPDDSSTAQVLASGPVGYGPIVVLILLAMLVAASIILISHALPKPKRHGPTKDATYESGMEVIGDARGRFNVRFYLVAMLFLLFDVELIFMYPWALLFRQDAAAGPAAAAQTTFLFWEMAAFFVILLVGYVYAWKKGVFRYD